MPTPDLMEVIDGSPIVHCSYKPEAPSWPEMTLNDTARVKGKYYRVMGIERTLGNFCDPVASLLISPADPLITFGEFFEGMISLFGLVAARSIV